jgi:hypothetical protein
MRKSFFVQIGDVGLFDVHMMDVEMHIDVRGADALAESTACDAVLRRWTRTG